MTAHKVQTLSVQELKKRRDANPKLCIIDVREQEEWVQERIPGAVHIPKDQLIEHIAAVVPDKNHPIYLHCRGGVRSLQAGQYLLGAGYQTVFSVDGGIVAWEQSGYPIEK